MTIIDKIDIYIENISLTNDISALYLCIVNEQKPTT